MRLDSGKIKGLIGQHPFIRDILAIPFDPQGGEGGNQVDDVIVTVERADHDLMFRQAENVGIGDGGHLIGRGPRANQIARQYECVVAVGADNRILDVLRWPNSHRETMSRPLVFAKYVFWAKRNGTTLSNPVWNRVERLVWVTVTAWYEDTRASESRFGEMRSRSVELTIYGKPDIGFERLEMDASLTRNLRVTTNLLSHGMRHNNAELIMLGGMVNELCAQFEEDVFRGGLTDVRYASAQFGPTRVNCGDASISLEDSVCRLHLCRDDRGGIYVAGMDGTIPQLRAMVRGVIRDWAKPDMRALLAPSAADHSGSVS